MFKIIKDSYGDELRFFVENGEIEVEIEEEDGNSAFLVFKGESVNRLINGLKEFLEEKQ